VLPFPGKHQDRVTKFSYKAKAVVEYMHSKEIQKKWIEVSDLGKK
jgi:hypothetical protein